MKKVIIDIKEFMNVDNTLTRINNRVMVIMGTFAIIAIVGLATAIMEIEYTKYAEREQARLEIEAMNK